MNLTLYSTLLLQICKSYYLSDTVGTSYLIPLISYMTNYHCYILLISVTVQALFPYVPG